MADEDRELLAWGSPLEHGQGSQWASALRAGRKMLQIPVGMENPDMALGLKGLSPPHPARSHYMRGFRAQGTEGGSEASRLGGRGDKEGSS